MILLCLSAICQSYFFVKIEGCARQGTNYPSKMSTPLKLCAVPVRTVMFRPICSYCGKSEKHYANCDVQLAVLACGDPEHQGWADRDAQAWLGRHQCVHPKHYREDPLFQETNLLFRDVVVPRSSGAIDYEGWVIRKPYRDDAALIRFYPAEEVWVVPVGNTSEDTVKHIPVCDLKLSLPVHKHGLVDAFELRLKVGFYRAAMRAYDEALEQQNEMDEPTAEAAAPRAEDSIVPAFHPTYGYGRVFVPSSAIPSASDPV